MRQDARFAFRQFLRTPAFSIVAILTLALGIGATTAIFSAVDAVLLHPLPYSHPEQLVILQENLPKIKLKKIAPNAANFDQYRRSATSFSQIAAMSNTVATLTGDGPPEDVNALQITASIFPLLGVRPIVGRLFTAEDEQRGKDRVAIISEGLWRQRFGGDPSIAGKKIQINRESYVVAGVVRPILDFRNSDDLWMPLSFTADLITPGANSPHNIDVIGRLKPGVTIAQAQDEFRRIAAHVVEQYPTQVAGDRTFSVDVDPLAQRLAGDLRKPLLLLIAAVSALMLIACANVSNLLLARAVARRREISIRVALGAGRARVIRQSLTESLLLSVSAGALGIAAAIYVLRDYARFAPEGLIRGLQPSINGWVAAFSLAISIVASIVFGLAPAIEASKTGVGEALRSGARGSSAGRRALRESLVAFEVAASLILLIGTGLLVRSFIRLASTSPGFKSENVLTLHLSLPVVQYGHSAQRVAFVRSLVERARAVPGVLSAAVVDFIPYRGSPGSRIQIPTHPIDFNVPTQVVWQTRTTPGYFETMGIPVLRGRDVAASDEQGSPPAAVIDQTVVNAFFSGVDPIGQKVTIPLAGADFTVVGVVGPTKMGDLSSAPAPRIYYFGPQIPFTQVNLLVKTAADPYAVAPALRHEIAALDSNLAIEVASMEKILGDSVARQKFAIELMTAFAALAALLAAIGIYGVLAYLVDQRKREIGIRVAVGASAFDVLALVLGQGSRPVLAGLAIGVAGALALTRLLSSLLYHVSPTDPFIFSAVAAGLVIIALIAMTIPAHRATRVDPVEALRQE